jgi:uncharacterized protein
MEDDQEQRPESLLPYDEWIESALRQVVVRAIEHVVANGLPGQHHFYLTFRTDHPDAVIPRRLREQYPQEMTVVLQHQFWDLKFDAETQAISVGLSFGGVPSTLVIPLGSLIGFADPHIRYGLRFRPQMPKASPPVLVTTPGEAKEAETPAEAPQVVSLDAFRRRPPPRS